MVYTRIKKKSKKIRVCAGFSMGLNDTLKNYHNVLLEPKEVFAQLGGCRIFSKINLSDVYLQIEVDDKCSKLLTINTHRGIFKSTQLAFRIKVTTAIFQLVMDMMLSELDYAVAYQDDILQKSENPKKQKKYFRGFQIDSEQLIQVKEKCYLKKKK